ncbi:MAG: TolC family protein [Ottowia sp.]|uniref:TolC family protein n=1 Tax=Ottowia sp. TaxID=1898956 RepID=UPI0039E6F2E8
MSARHHLIRRGVCCALALLPALVSGQEDYPGPAQAAPQAAAKAPAGTEVGRPGTWRDRLTPFHDPLRTEPASLRQPLAVPLPPDLLATPPGARPRPDAGGLLPTEWPCATRPSASSAGGPQHALGLLQAAQAQAPQPGQPYRLSLPTAIHLALCHHPQVRASWSTVAQQAAQLGQARSAYWPQLAAGVGRQRSRAGYSGAAAPAETVWATRQHAVVSWRLWDFGARGARADAAQAQLQAALRTQDATVRKALADVLQAYGEAQAAQARLATQHSLRPLAERGVQAAQRRLAGGAGSGNDVLQAAAALARTNLELSRSQGELDKAHAQLAYLLGLPSGTAYRTEAAEPAPESAGGAGPRGEGDDPHRLLARSLDDWLSQASQGHPAVLAARAQWQAAQASLQAVQSEGLPTLDFSLAHYRNGRPDMAPAASRSRESVVGLSLNIPLFDGFAHTYKVRAAQALVEQKAAELQATEQQTRQDIVQLHAEARAALNNLQAARSLYAVSAEAAQSAQRQYDQGAADIVQFNQSLGNLQQAQLELARSRTDWNKARLRLWLQDTALE